MIRYLNGLPVEMDAAEIAALEASRVPPTDAERAAAINLSPAQLWGELDDLLPQHAPTETYVEGVIDASPMAAAEKARAKAAIRRAQSYRGDDPLLHQVGALLGLDADAMHDLIIAAATREGV